MKDKIIICKLINDLEFWLRASLWFWLHLQNCVYTHSQKKIVEITYCCIKGKQQPPSFWWLHLICAGAHAVQILQHKPWQIFNPGNNETSEFNKMTIKWQHGNADMAYPSQFEQWQKQKPLSFPPYLKRLPFQCVLPVKLTTAVKHFHTERTKLSFLFRSRMLCFLSSLLFCRSVTWLKLVSS